MSIISFLIPSFLFYFQSCFYFSIALLGIFFVWYIFTFCIFSLQMKVHLMEAVSDDLGEHTYKDLDDWDKLGFYFGLRGISRMAV
jgi:hypothetical protein